MTLRDPAAPVAAPLPELPADAALVALVPAVADLNRAAAAAWEYARLVANAGRRVALIDCYVDAPRLHAVAGESNEDGIVDVFEYGASLSRIARAQPEGTLFFVPAGTFSPDPAGMMARPRWRRLSAGFRHEDAVMLLFLPPDCIGALASDVDGLVALVPGDPDVDLAATPEIRAALDRGTPLLATFSGAADAAPAAPLPRAPAPAPPVTAAPGPVAPVSAAPAPAAPEPRDEPEPAASLAESESPLAPPPLSTIEPVRSDAGGTAAPPDWPILQRTLRSGAPRRRLGAYVLLLVLAAAAAVFTYRRQLGWNDVAPEPSAPQAPLTPAFRALVPHAVDTLPFAVQIAAWTSLPQALEDADTVQARGFLPMISPVRLQRTVWYRVYAGPVASQDAADSLLGAVRTAGLDGSRTATVALVPFSFALRRVATPLAARAARDRLRSAGVAAFVLGQADGSYQLLTGAFAQPDQAAYLDSLLTSTGNAGQLGPRVGFHP